MLGSFWLVNSLCQHSLCVWLFDVIFITCFQTSIYLWVLYQYQQFTPLPGTKGLLNSGSRFKVHHKLRQKRAKEKQRRDLLVFLPLWEEQNWTRCPNPLALNRTAKGAYLFLRSILHNHRNRAVFLSSKDQEVGFLQADSLCLVYSLSSSWVCILSCVTCSGQFPQVLGFQGNDMHF